MPNIDKALKEINEIERLIKPFEYYYEAKGVLAELADLRNALNKMDKVGIKQAIEKLSRLETIAAPYRGSEPVDEVLQHVQRLKEELKKLLKK